METLNDTITLRASGPRMTDLYAEMIHRFYIILRGVLTSTITANYDALGTLFVEASKAIFDRILNCPCCFKTVSKLDHIVSHNF